MTLQVALQHVTHYRYGRPVEVGPQTIRLRPAPHCRTPISAYSLRIEPDEHFINWQQDPQGNFLARIVVPEKTSEFRVVVDIVAEMAVINPFDFFVEQSATQWPFDYDGGLLDELQPFLEKRRRGPRLSAWLDSLDSHDWGDISTIDFLVALNQRLASEIEYVIRLEPGVQTPEETLGLARGSCRDTSWLLVQILRHLGVAARFASGYLIQLVADVPSLDGPVGPTEDFTDLHAWAEAYIPGAGWVGLDPTSGLLVGEGHIPLACGAAPQSAAPISGAVEPCDATLEHTMSVERILESPRVTKPYTEETWRAIDRLGHEIDARLQREDVRLTMGGEPTFVSVDDMESAEWNTDAEGPTKRVLAADLVGRLRERFSPGGLLHCGQGKWYPGEELPRWAFSLYWRSDGEPLWRNPKRIAAEGVDYGPTCEVAEQFARSLAEQLDVDPGAVLPAYEDPLELLAAQSGLPENFDPGEIEDERTRRRLLRSLERSAGAPAGFVLPVQAWNARAGGRRWRSEKWSFARGRLYLAPGDSPLGFRLPMGSLPYIRPLDYPHVIAADPLAERPPFAAPAPRRQTPAARPRPPVADRASAREAPSGDAPVRTALAFEPRDGRLCVFLPPVELADDFVDLVTAIEAVSEALDTPVHVEGYPPPSDARLHELKVTPDPGVIEVNIHPSESWPELVDKTECLYEQARLTRLATEKFMLDGRHTGTGGGNHVVVGGATPWDSPFLRRPHLLRSLVGYWLNHPSLSYLFSGLFIGPTSQAPRVDEARHDSLYELEIAFAQIPDSNDAAPPPWLVDRIFRNLLVDVSGNTHRAEFCIDKLYSPDSATGRLGLVELRAFEMPPHARMSLVQQLLLRALIARFWSEPYRVPPTRWGTSLHDRFLLPHFIWQDLGDVVRDLAQAGCALRTEWFAPHFEFRFPLCGSFQAAGVSVELRTALEPWHVLGEEGGAGATARYVDSSLERLQVSARGLVPGRHEIGCNGVRVPLHPTGTGGEAVAGVRFRAWQPARCLHPTIPVHAPLTFDLFDTWSERAVGGCRYHVAHPGGRSHEQFPVNAFEAEGRRLARFFPFGHTPGLTALFPASPDPDFPMTLDLRRFPHESQASSAEERGL